MAEIARSAGCSLRSVRNVAHRGGLTLPQARRRADRQERLEDVTWLRLQVEEHGKAASALADVLGAELNDVRAALAAAGVAQPKRAPRHPQLHEPGWLGGQLTRRDLEELVNCCGELLAERVRIERLLIGLRPAAGRTSGEIYELYRAVGNTPPEPAQHRR